MIKKEKTVFIAGAKSDIAREIAFIYAEKGFNLQLGARNKSSLKSDSRDYLLRGASSTLEIELDIESSESIKKLIKKLKPFPDIVICAIGFMGEKNIKKNDYLSLQRIVYTNLTGPALFLEQIAEEMIKNGNGSIVGISSVAGERGRASNYWYGSAKSGFSTFLSGLRQRVSDKGIHVMTVKPGFVKTKMTFGYNFPDLLTAYPDQVAQEITKACQQKKNSLYTPWFWRIIMFVIKIIPEIIFKKIKI